MNCINIFEQNWTTEMCDITQKFCLGSWKDKNHFDILKRSNSKVLSMIQHEKTSHFLDLLL